MNLINTDKKISATVRYNTLPFLENSQSQGNKFASEELTFYQIARVLELEGFDNVDKLYTALAKLIASNPNLISVFQKPDELYWQQIIYLKQAVPIDVIELSTTDLSDDAIFSRLKEIHDTHFDMSEGPLMKFTIGVMDNSARLLFVKVHHEVCDGYSLALLGKLLVKNYQELDNKTISKPSQIIVKREDAEKILANNILEHQKLDLNHKTKSLKWWASKLNPVVEDMKSKFPDDSTPTSSVHILNEKQIGAYIIQARKENITLSNLLAAVFVMSVNQVTNVNRINFGVQRFNRPFASRYSILALSEMYNIIVSAESQNAITTAKRIAQFNSEAQNYDLPYWYILRNLYPNRYKAHVTLSPYFFNFNPSYPEKLEINADTHINFRSDLMPNRRNRKYALSCECIFNKKAKSLAIIMTYYSGWNIPEKNLHDITEHFLSYFE